MTRFVDLLSRVLEPAEREAVCGDFEESGESEAQALRDLLGLIARRQAALWTGWRPWLALLTVVIPLGITLSQVARQLAGSSAVYSWMYVNNWTMTYLTNTGFRGELLHDALTILLEYLALLFWSWTVGFVVGSLSRGALWVNGALFSLLLLAELAVIRPGGYGVNAAAFAVEFYRVVWPLILRIGLVLIPSLLGMRYGARLAALSLPQIAGWATALVILAACTGIFGWRHFPAHLVPRLLLLIPAWPVAYMIAATGWKRWHES
jgi:hypothetical protein